jgi:hypothetical protein
LGQRVYISHFSDSKLHNSLLHVFQPILCVSFSLTLSLLLTALILCFVELIRFKAQTDPEESGEAIGTLHHSGGLQCHAETKNRSNKRIRKIIKRISWGNNTEDKRTKESCHKGSNDSSINEILETRGNSKGRVVLSGEVGVVGINGWDASKDELDKKEDVSMERGRKSALPWGQWHRSVCQQQRN